MISDLTASLADKTLPEKLRRYARPDFLIIDAFGCDLIERQESPQSAHLLYKIIDLRNQRKSTALATNVDFEKWGNYLSDGPLAMAFLDRIVEKAIILKVQGKSYRAHGPREGEQPAKALLRDAMQRTLQAAEIAGIRALAVHAKNEKARRFYEHFDFVPSPTDPMHLFVLLKDVRRIVAE